MNDEREQLAAYAHEAWSGWMRYLFEKCRQERDGAMTIPPWAVERWQRQMNTSYADLPEDEKGSDRREADKILAIVATHPDGVCTWTPDGWDDGWGNPWMADCGLAWELTKGTPKENDMLYCPACGRRIAEASAEADAPEPTNPLRAKVVARGDEEGV